MKTIKAWIIVDKDGKHPICADGRRHFQIRHTKASAVRCTQFGNTEGGTVIPVEIRPLEERTR